MKKFLLSTLITMAGLLTPAAAAWAGRALSWFRLTRTS